MRASILTSYPATPVSVPGVGGVIKPYQCYIPLHLPLNSNYNKILNDPHSSTIVEVDQKLTVDAPVTKTSITAEKNNNNSSIVKPVPEMYEQLPASTFTPKKLTSQELAGLKRDRSPSPSRSKHQKIH